MKDLEFYDLMSNADLTASRVKKIAETEPIVHIAMRYAGDTMTQEHALGLAVIALQSQVDGYRRESIFKAEYLGTPQPIAPQHVTDGAEAMASAAEDRAPPTVVRRTARRTAMFNAPTKHPFVSDGSVDIGDDDG